MKDLFITVYYKFLPFIAELFDMLQAAVVKD
jgi:hypothetical protein